MAILDVIQFNGLAGRDWLVYKFPGNDFASYSRLVVGEGQVAVFVKGGQAMDFFTAGTYELSTNNIPILSRFINLPFGGKTPFTAEVYYINRTTKLDINWGTSDPIQIIDAKYNIKLRVRAFGQIGLKVHNYRVFLTELIGSLGDREVVQFARVLDFYKGILMTKIKTTIAQILVRDKISALEISAHLDEISQKCQGEVEEEFGQYGIRVVNLFIKSINFPNEDFEAINKILADRAAFDIIGDSRYVSKRSFDVMESAARNEGGMAGIGPGLGVGLGVGAVVGGNMAGMATGHLHPQVEPPAGSAVCPTCGAAGAADARFCAKCGAAFPALAKAKCVSCGVELPADARFCHSCGVSQERKGGFCANCGSKIEGTERFCSTCGKSVT